MGGGGSKTDGGSNGEEGKIMVREGGGESNGEEGMVRDRDMIHIHLLYSGI